MQNAATAVIITRANAKRRKNDVDENDLADGVEETLLETRKKRSEDQKKFENFWKGVRTGLDAYEKKHKYEKKEYLHGKTTKKSSIINENVFNPNSGWKIVWDLLLAALVIYSIVVIPYNIGMAVDPGPVSQAVDWLITVLFGIDILVNFNTAYIDGSTEKLEYNRTKIAINYSKFWLWVDILATIPFDTIIGAFVNSSHFSTIRVIRVLRLIRLMKIYRIFAEDERMESTFSNPALFSLIVLILQIFYVAHIFACFFHYITLDAAVGNFPTTWVQKFNFQDKPVNERYVASLYYVIVTMTTVGYGDIYGTNQLERFFAILTMLTGGVVFGALVGRVTSLIDKRNPQAKAFKEKMDEFKCFLQECLIPKEVANRAKASYFYYLSKRSAFGETGIFDELPRAILKELVYQLYSDDISKINMLHSTESAFVIELIMNSRPFQTFENENIFQEGDVCNEIIFIKDGNIRILSSAGHKNMVIGCVTEGDYFGDAEFLKNTTAMATYQSVGNCHMLSVPHVVMSRAMAAASSTTSTQLNRWFEQRYANLSSLLRSKGVKKPKIHRDKSSPTKHLKSKKSSLFGMNRTVSNHGRSFFGFSMLSGNDQTDSFRVRSRSKTLDFEFDSDSDDDDPDDKNRLENSAGSPALRGKLGMRGRPMLTRQASKSEAKFKLDTISRNLWVNGEIQDASTSMAFLSIDDKMPKHIKKIRVVVVNRQGIPEAVEKPAKLLQDNHLLNPIGDRKIQWDFFIGVLILYSVLVVPVEIAFNGEAFKGSNSFNLVINGFFFIDIVLSFFTAIQSEALDALIVDPRTIAIEYLKSWFLIDLISTIPFDDIVSAATDSGKNLSFTKLVKVIRLLRLLKLARILKLSSYIEKIEDSLGISPAFFSLLSLLIQVFFIAHWACCLWWGLTSFASDIPWFMNYGSEGQGLGFFPLDLPHGSIKARYLMTLYYILTTMTTVGYGDIRPTTVAERAMGIVLALCGASLFGYMIANVSGLLSSLGGANSSAKEHISEVSEYLKEKNCPALLQDKIMNHYKRQVKEMSAYDVDRIVGRLPSMISNEILFYLNEKRMQKISFFHFIHNKSVAVYLLQKLSPIFCDEGHYFFREGEYCKEITFIVAGEAHAFRNKVVQRSKPAFVKKADFNEADLWQRVMDMQLNDAEASYDMGLDMDEEDIEGEDNELENEIEKKEVEDEKLARKMSRPVRMNRENSCETVKVIKSSSLDIGAHHDVYVEDDNEEDELVNYGNYSNNPDGDMALSTKSPSKTSFPTSSSPVLSPTSSQDRTMNSPSSMGNVTKLAGSSLSLVNPLSIRGNYRHPSVRSTSAPAIRNDNYNNTSMINSNSTPGDLKDHEGDKLQAATTDTSSITTNLNKEVSGRKSSLSVIFGSLEESTPTESDPLITHDKTMASTTTNAKGETSAVINNFELSIGLEAWEKKYLNRLEEQKAAEEKKNKQKLSESTLFYPAEKELKSKKSVMFGSIVDDNITNESGIEMAPPQPPYSALKKQLSTGNKQARFANLTLSTSPSMSPANVPTFPTQFPTSSLSNTPNNFRGNDNKQHPVLRKASSVESVTSLIPSEADSNNNSNSNEDGTPSFAKSVLSTFGFFSSNAKSTTTADNGSTNKRRGSLSSSSTNREYNPLDALTGIHPSISRKMVTNNGASNLSLNSNNVTPRGTGIGRYFAVRRGSNTSMDNSTVGSVVNDPINNNAINGNRRRRVSVQQTNFLPLKQSLSFMISSRDEAPPDPIDEYAKKRRKPLMLLNANDYEHIGYQFLGKLEVGDFVGHSAFLRKENEEQHHCSVRTVHPTTAYVISKQDIFKLIRVEPTVAIQFQAALKEAVMEQATLKSKSHLQGERAVFLRNLRRKYQSIKHRSTRNKLRRLSMAVSTPRLSISQLQKPQHQQESGKNKSKKDSTEDGPRFTFWEASRDSEAPGFWANSTSNKNKPSASGNFISRWFGSNQNQNNTSFSNKYAASVTSGYESSGGDSVKGVTSKKKTQRRIHKLFKHNRIYYDSDDSQEDLRRKKRQQYEEATRMERVVMHLQSSLREVSARLKLEDSFNSLDNKKKSPKKKKRATSLTAVDYTYANNKSSIDSLFQPPIGNSDNNSNEPSVQNSAENSPLIPNNTNNNNSNSFLKNVMRRRTLNPSIRLSPKDQLLGRDTPSPALPDGRPPSRSLHYNNFASIDNELDNANTTAKMMRRQSFPSIDNDDWKRSKLQDFLI